MNALYLLVLAVLCCMWSDEAARNNQTHAALLWAVFMYLSLGASIYYKFR